MLASTVRARTSLPELYLRALGATLLLEGLAMLALGRLPDGSIPTVLAAFQPDPPHELLHVTWGVALLAIPMLFPRHGAALVALAFGVFYVGLAALGILVYHPLGLRLDLGQNVFHSLVGPLTLAVGAWLVAHPPAGTGAEGTGAGATDPTRARAAR